MLLSLLKSLCQDAFSALTLKLSRTKRVAAAATLHAEGVTAIARGDLRAGQALIRQALAKNPDSLEILCNLGAALSQSRQYEEALRIHQHVTSRAPQWAHAWYNYGIPLFETLRIDEAITAFSRAIALEENNVPAHCNLALAWLLQGNFAQGWPEYEWRRQANAKDMPQFSGPEWSGKEPLRGKTLLLYHEQGLGDGLQFCRYASLATNQGAAVILLVPPPLSPLLQTLEGAASVHTNTGTLPHYDYHLPLLSAPLVFNTRHENIPASVPYLHVDPDRLSHWQKRLGTTSVQRIGISWSGSPGHVSDFSRSMSLSLLLTALPADVQLVVLQKEIRADDLATLALRPDIQFFTDELTDFADTAALCSLMDLVISVDTSIVHLAGALAKPVWILLSYCPDWRWLLERQDSPWYPTARLFRQTSINDWTPVLAEIRHSLQSA